MSGGLISYALLAALATALLVAAFTDLRRREIDNGLNAAIAAAAPIWWLSIGLGWQDMAFQIALAAGTLAIAALFFAMRQMGGGDVKLLTALALWFTPGSFLQLVVLMAVIGGGASIGMAAFNMKRVRGEAWRDALAMAVALAWIWCACRIVLAVVMHEPVISADTVQVITVLLPGASVMAAGAAAVSLIFYLGFSHIVRRQRSRLPIPYGIAISAAGLWVLGEQTLATAHLAAGAG